jgi:PepSY-associated transmembrane protein
VASYATMTARSIVLKIHIYAGLLTFSQLMIYGLAGLSAAVQPGLERPKVPRAIRQLPFTPPVSATDKQVAAAVYTALGLPLARPIPDWFLQRTPDNDLLLDFYNINGIWRVAVLEREQRLRIEQIHNSAWLFLSDVHAATIGDSEAPGIVRLWAVYNELAMWCLLAFCASGLYLWLSVRGRGPWAWASLAAGTVGFCAFWLSFR